MTQNLYPPGVEQRVLRTRFDSAALATDPFDGRRTRVCFQLTLEQARGGQDISEEKMINERAEVYGC